jgi:hypothetical protein
MTICVQKRIFEANLKFKIGNLEQPRWERLMNCQAPNDEALKKFQ